MPRCRKRRRGRRAHPSGVTPHELSENATESEEQTFPDESILLHHSSTSHHDAFVYQLGNARYLTFEAGANAPVQSAVDLDEPSRVLGDYRQGLVAVSALLNNPKRLLCLGAGGGTVTKALLDVFPEAHVDAVDIDGHVFEIARQWFGLQSSPRLHLHAVDAREYVRRACADGEKWDVILHDVFDRHYTPAHLMTLEYFTEVGKVLEEGGVLAINGFSQGMLLEREKATYSRAFAHVYEIGCSDGNRITLAADPRLLEDARLSMNLHKHAGALARVGIELGEMWRRIRHIDALSCQAEPLVDEVRQQALIMRLRRLAVAHARCELSWSGD